MTKSPVRHWADYSLTAEQIRRYQEMPLEKRLEWLYLGNVLRKMFCDEIDKMQEALKTEQG